MRRKAKRWAALAMAAAMAMSLAACSQTDAATDAQTEAPSAAPTEAATEAGTEAAAEKVSGTFEGTAQGFHGPVTVEVTLEEGVITDVQVTSHSESEGVSDYSIEETPRRILEAQSWNVDTLSGATYSSMAVKYAARDAIEASGAVGLDTEVHEEQPDDETIDTDVVIVGAGMAGISAAIEAKEAGADVIVLEKLDRIGGSAITSGGIVYGTNTLMNRDIDNDPEDMVEYYIERGNSNIDVDIVRFWAEHSGESVDWLIEDMGVEFATLGASGTSPAQRAHTTANGGAGIILPMFEQFEALDIELHRDTPVTELIYDGERVTGVVAEHDGATVTIHADAVIVACGGFDASEEAKELYAPDAAGVACMSSCGNTGDYIAWGEAVGASMIFKGGVMGMHSTNPAYTLTGGINLLSFIPTLGVTDEGVRFENEANDYPIFFTAMVETGRDMFYWIFDSNSGMTELCEETVNTGYGYKADTLEELAEAAGMPAETFMETVARYNELGAAGVDEDFGREGITPLAEEGPYYAIEVVKATVAGFGGFEINTDSQVLDTEGNPIPGLYAAGECASGQFFYKEYPCSGSMLCISATFGRIAGQNAAAEAAAAE